jgi:hypothetical protein
MLRQSGRYTAALGVASVLAACQPRTETYHEPATVGSTPMLLTTADLRTIAERPHPMGDRRMIICTEPPPDVAKALSTALALSASGGNGSIQGALSGSSATAEQLAELAGRVPGLLALRDTLFRACEAYGNGMLGDDAYGLIVSRYGEMLTTLILGDALSTSSASLAKLEGLNLSLSPTQNNTEKKPQTSPGTSTPPKSAPPGNGPSLSGSASNNHPESVRSQIASLDPAFVQAPTPQPGNRAGRQGQQPGSAPGAPARSPAAPNSKPPQTNSRAAGSTQSIRPATDSNGAAIGQGLEQMQANYMALGILGPLMVACVNEHDPTRRGMYPAGATSTLRQNDLLGSSFCSHYIEQLTQLELVERLKKANASESEIKKIIGIQ